MGTERLQRPAVQSGLIQIDVKGRDSPVFLGSVGIGIDKGAVCDWRIGDPNLGSV